MMRKWSWTASLCAAALMVAGAGAEGLADFGLTKAIPSDAVMAVHARNHEGQAFVNEQMERVWREVEAAQFDRDIKKLFRTLATEGGQTPEAFEQNWQKIVDLGSAVDWGSLCEREMAFTFKMGFPMPEYVLLMQPPTDKLQANFEGLSGIVKELVGLAPGQLELTTEGQDETVTHRVIVTGAPFPLGATLARAGDTIMLSIGTTMGEQVLAMLAGSAEGAEALAATDRFKEAVGKLPAPRDSVFFFDLTKFFLQLRGMIEQAMQMAPLPPPEDPGYQQAVAMKDVPGKIINRLDIFDYVAAVATTDGMKTTTDSVMVLKEGAQESGLYKALFGGDKLDDPLRHVPRDAENMSAAAGFDLLALYDFVITILREDIPDGEQAITHINSLKEQIGYDLREDILGWIGSRFISFSMPAPTAYQSGEFAMLLGVRDEAKAATMVNALMDMVAQQGGQNLAVEPATITGTEGFRSLKSPMLGMMGLKAPTIGLHGGWLWVGSSPEIIEQSMRVAAGEEENFSKNERFRKEGLPLADGVTAISFTDMTKWGDQMGQALGSVAMIQMFVPDIAKNPPLQAMMGMLSKAGRVLRQVNFLLSSASVTTLEGRTMTSRSIVNYREPPAPPAKPTPPGESESESESDGATEAPTEGSGVE